MHTLKDDAGKGDYRKQVSAGFAGRMNKKECIAKSPTAAPHPCQSARTGAKSNFPFPCPSIILVKKEF